VDFKMPTFAILNGKVVRPSDIYKFSLAVDSPFTCFNCDGNLHFKQSRNGSSDFTEHFFHPNTKKDTHIECERVSNSASKPDVEYWHQTMSTFIKSSCREVLRKSDLAKHIADCYDAESGMGVEFQNSPISVEDVKSRDATSELDWIFNCEGQFMRKVEIGNYVVCEIPHDNWAAAVKAVKDNVFLYTGFNEWIWLVDRESYRIELEGHLYNVWIGEPCSFQDVLDNTCLKSTMTVGGKKFYRGIEEALPVSKIAYARCAGSMRILDGFHRDYINHHIFAKNEVVAIKSVAGSGKTTTLLRLAEVHSEKRILYLAFNKSLIEDIKGKLSKLKIRNMEPLTFDALIYRLFRSVRGAEPTLCDLRPQNVGQFYPWLEDKPFVLKKYYAKKFEAFCEHPGINDMETFCKEVLGKKQPILEALWERALSGRLTTFNSMRKMALINHWFKDYIDKHYDMVMVDETQDFDMIMLKMLLNDTAVPKLFVGDPKQAIYEWRGCINAFTHMPPKALVMEFYSTFRVGDPACSTIRNLFSDCWMISKSSNMTRIEQSCSGGYVYLFRTWRSLLTTARVTPNSWIYGFDKKAEDMRKLYEILVKKGGKKLDDEDEFEDDLPKFLRSLTREELDDLINEVSANLVDKEKSRVKFYTVHSYKGMEDDVVRLSSDIDIKTDENIYYVAITRAKKSIVLDGGMPVKGSAKPIVATQANMESFIDMISGTTAQVKEKRVLPAQAGKRWTDDETGKLLISIQKKLSIAEIATKHQRTHGAISSMLRQLAVRYIADGYDMALAQRFTGLSETVIRDAIAKSEMRAAARK
jgi:hypothetical protein